jgi:hypothetical protein
MGPLVMLVLLWVWQTYALANKRADHCIASWYYLPGPLITLMACKGRAGIPHCPPPLPLLMSAAQPSYDGPLGVASVIHTNSIHC